MSNALPLPYPYVPGTPGAGLDGPDIAERIQQNFDKIALALGQPVVSSAWTAPTLGTNWATLSGNDAGYTKDANRFVHLRGVVKATGAATTAFTLPASYRPEQETIFLTMRYPGATPFVIGFVIVRTTGSVEPFNASAGAPVANDQYYLDGMTFRAEA